MYAHIHCLSFNINEIIFDSPGKFNNRETVTHDSVAVQQILLDLKQCVGRSVERRLVASVRVYAQRCVCVYLCARVCVSACGREYVSAGLYVCERMCVFACVRRCEASCGKKRSTSSQFQMPI